MSTDRELIDRIVSGDSQAYTTVYTKHFGMVRYLVVNNQGNDEDAQDVFHDTMIVIIEKAADPGFELTASLKTFIYSIARNIWYARARKNKGVSRMKDYEEFEDVSVKDLSQKQQTEEQLSLVEACIEQLGEPCKTLLIQFYYFKKSMQDVATQLGYQTADHAKSQKYKCMKRLKKLALGG